MSAVWKTARTAVRRRKLQTTIIAVVVMCSTATITMALALLTTAAASFDRAFDQQQGAHLVAVFDPTEVSPQQLVATESSPAVIAAAGPFPQTSVEVSYGPGYSGPMRSGPLTVVGRDDPAGAIDRVDLWQGRWATGPGEIVLNDVPPPPGFQQPVGFELTLADGQPLTVVGYAHSLSQTADAWVSSEQMGSLDPSSSQMLYRVAEASSPTGIESARDQITSGLPAGSLRGSQSYLTIKDAFATNVGVYVPFLLTFGLLGLVVAVLIVANVVSGAVISGLRQIGILKAIGFTPRQVVASYLLMVVVPALAGCVLGATTGRLGAQPLLTDAFGQLGLGTGGISWWVDAATLVGMLATVVLAALVPAWRAHRLPAAEAISTGSAPRVGRGRRVQRWLGATRLPRPVSLGLGLPLARPTRTGLTLAAVLLGVMTVTFATGLAGAVNRYTEATHHNDQVRVRANPEVRGEAQSTRSDPQVEALLRALPGTVRLTAGMGLTVPIAGYAQAVDVTFLRGDTETVGYLDQVVRGRWLERPGELVAPSRLLRERGLSLGDQVTLGHAGDQMAMTIVGETMAGPPGPGVGFLADWGTLDLLAPEHEVTLHDVLYQIQVEPGTEIPDYLNAVMTADPGLGAWENRQTDEFAVTVVTLSTALTLILGTVAALGVFHTVVLNTRERRRDLGMLKSIGMTPRQVTAMVVTSMAALGAVGGLLGVPAGMVAHRLVVPLVAEAAQVNLAASVLRVWQAPTLGLLLLAGVAIAVLGAILPARAAARLPIAEVLHNE